MTIILGLFHISNCPTKKCGGGGGREIALGLDTQEGIAFGSTWDALELQYTDHLSERGSLHLQKAQWSLPLTNHQHKDPTSYLGGICLVVRCTHKYTKKFL